MRRREPVRHDDVACAAARGRARAMRPPVPCAYRRPPAIRPACRPPGLSDPRHCSMPFSSAAFEPNMSNISLPGLVVSGKRMLVMSKSNSSMRFCTSAIIGGALVDLDAELLQIADVHADDARQRRLIIQNLESERLILAVAQSAVAIFPAGLLEQGFAPAAGWPAASPADRCAAALAQDRTPPDRACRAGAPAAAIRPADGMPVAASSLLLK